MKHRKSFILRQTTLAAALLALPLSALHAQTPGLGTTSGMPTFPLNAGGTGAVILKANSDASPDNTEWLYFKVYQPGGLVSANDWYSYPTAWMTNSDFHFKNLNLRLYNSNELELGAGVAGKETNAGKLCYGCYGSTALSIVGAGSTAPTRRLKLWAEGGTELTGGASIAGDLNLNYNGYQYFNNTGGTLTGAIGPNISTGSLTYRAATGDHAFYAGTNGTTARRLLSLKPTGELNVPDGGFLTGDNGLTIRGTNATATVNADAVMLRMRRPSTTNAKWDGVAEFRMGSFGTGLDAQTRMDIVLNQGNTDGVYFGQTGSNAGNNASSVMTLLGDGRVGIGVSNMPTAFQDNTDLSSTKLFVNGGILAKGTIICKSTWADYVFAPGYKLKPLNEVESYVEANGHLPGMPAAKDVEANGLDMAKTARLQQEKIEELTLYIIQMKRDMDVLKAQVNRGRH